MKSSTIRMAGFIMMAALADSASSHAQQTDDPVVSVKDALNCRLTASEYTGFALSVSGADGIASSREWRQIKSANVFMNEYEMPDPVVVAGGHETRRVGFTANAIVALVDISDPTELARSEGIENVVDAGPLVAALMASGKDKLEQRDGEPAFRKFLGERVLVDVTEKPTDPEEWGTHSVIARTISTVSTHPGKTLYGCSYRIEMTDKDGNAL